MGVQGALGNGGPLVLFLLLTLCEMSQDGISRDGGGTGNGETSPVKIGLEKIQQLGPQIAEFLKAAEPALRAVYPYCHLAKQYGISLYIALEPYHTEEVAEVLLALTLLFLGGQFAMTIACYQAFRMSGSFQCCWIMLPSYRWFLVCPKLPGHFVL